MRVERSSGILSGELGYRECLVKHSESRHRQNDYSTVENGLALLNERFKYLYR